VGSSRWELLTYVYGFSVGTDTEQPLASDSTNCSLKLSIKTNSRKPTPNQNPSNTHPPRWGIIVLIAETPGLTAVIPYGWLLWLHTQPSNSRGLPVDDGRVVLPPEKRFNVHILVPCYKVGLGGGWGGGLEGGGCMWGLGSVRMGKGCIGSGGRRWGGSVAWWEGVGGGIAGWVSGAGLAAMMARSHCQGASAQPTLLQLRIGARVSSHPLQALPASATPQIIRIHPRPPARPPTRAPSARPQESMDVICGTVSAALGAAVPPGVTRTVYLCDDGKDPKKKEYIAGLGAAAKCVGWGRG